MVCAAGIINAMKLLDLTDTDYEQQKAADPRASVWVSASAGSGKTKVLTDRVLNLLLNNTPAHRILCLTFTKAAAAEMARKDANRKGKNICLERE